jgi:hypothetical protein
VQEPRSAGALGKEFPYLMGTMCYIEVTQDGAVTWGNDREAYERARAGTSRLFAVWPGQYQSHLFAIDDLDEYARAKGLIHDQERTGLAQHKHKVRWSISPHEKNPTGGYIGINVVLDCGCSIRDLKTFAAQMREQKGWNIATSGGWGYVGNPDAGYTYSMRAQRRSLSQ